MPESTLVHAVVHLADVTHGLSEAQLARNWTWRYHDEGVRFALIGTYHELRDLAATMADERARSGSPITLAQRVMGQYHASYRDLQAFLIGVSDEEGARVPAEGEWPLCGILDHMIQTERIFFALIIYALEHQRQASDEPLPEIDEAWANAFYGDDNAAFDAIDGAPLHNILAYYDGLHERILNRLAELSDRELDVGSLWWEKSEIPVRFRMHRFEAHMLQHTIQVQKTLAMLGLAPNEAKLLLRRIYAALAEAEGATLGSDLANGPPWNDLATMISARADEIAGMEL